MATTPKTVEVDTILPTLEKAYLALLQMPFGSVRIRNQATFAQVRDSIAELSGRTPQQVQEDFEDRLSDVH